MGRFLRGGGFHEKIMRMTKFAGKFEDIASVENLLEAWREFLSGKREKRDVQKFSLCLMDNIFALHRDLVDGVYRHGGYHAFNISDPKPRSIHKATVRDRLVHHAIYRVLYPFFDRTFIADSYSCRFEKGTHKALNRFRSLFYRVSRNNTRTCWVLKCDIKKFFASIDHVILEDVLVRRIADPSVLSLLSCVIESFSSTRSTAMTRHSAGIDLPSPLGFRGVGLPLGNLTSQLFANIYMNEFDQFVKHMLCAKHYIRYADDFVILSENREWLEQLVPKIAAFLADKLKLQLHPDKVFIKTFASGIDFLGWVHFPDHRVLRTTTKRRMLKRIRESSTEATLNSYLGLVWHGNAQKLATELRKQYLLHNTE